MGLGGVGFDGVGWEGMGWGRMECNGVLGFLLLQ